MGWQDKLTPQQRATAQKVAYYAQKHNVPPELALGMAMQESTLSQNKKSGTGPMGVMMVGRAAAKDLGIDRRNEDQNIEGGVRYMRNLLDKHNNDVNKALVAYHDGPNSPYFRGGQPSPAAQNHVEKVREYAGMAAPQFDTSIADIEPAPLLTQQAEQPASAARQRDATDYVAGAAGAAAGYAFGPDKPLTHKQIETQRLILAQEREARQAMEANKAAAGAKNQFATGVENWIPTQYNEEISRMIQNPTSQANAASQGTMAEARAAASRQLYPHQVPAAPGSMINVPLQVGGGQKALPMTEAAPAAAVPQAHVPGVINPGSKLGRAANTVAGGVAAAQGYDAAQRAGQGDVVGAGLGALSSAGAGATMMRNPKAKALGAATAIGAGGLQQAYDWARDKFELKKPESVMQKYAGGGAVAKKLAAGAANILRPSAEEIAKFAPRPTQQVKFSEALAPHEGSYLGVHMSDRYGTHGGRMGGTGFPNFQNVNPLHAKNEVVWMNDSETAARQLAKQSQFNGVPMVHTNYIGSPTQHMSNKTVHGDIYNQFQENLKANKVRPETIERINARIKDMSRTEGTQKNRVFDTPFDIRDQFAAQELGSATFNGRKELSNILGTGTGVGGVKHTAVPEFENILRSHADPLTEGAPTSAVGTRLFDIYNQPPIQSNEFHPDYRWTVHGKDKGVQFNAVPQDVALPDWVNAYRQSQGGKDPHGNAWMAYPRTPQRITEEYLRGLQDKGYADGGLVYC